MVQMVKGSSLNRGLNLIDSNPNRDGATNDAAIINAALTSAVAAKEPLYIPSGKYKCNSKITIPEGAIVICEHMGKQALDAFSDIGATFVFDSTVTGNLVECSDRAYIVGLHVKGGNVASTVGMYGDRYNTWIDCTVTQCEESFEARRWSNHLIRCNSKNAYIAAGNHIGFILGIAASAVANDCILEDCISDAGDSTTAGGRNIVFYGGFGSVVRGGNWGDALYMLHCPSSTGGGKLDWFGGYAEQVSGHFFSIAHSGLHVNVVGGWYNNQPHGASSTEYFCDISNGNFSFSHVKVQGSTSMAGMVNHTGGGVYWGEGNRHDTPKAINVADQSGNDNFQSVTVIPFSYTWDISDGDLEKVISVPYSGFNPELMLKSLHLQNLTGPSGTTLAVSVGRINNAGTKTPEEFMANLNPTNANTGTNTDATDTQLTAASSNITLGAGESIYMRLTDNSETTGNIAIVGEFLRFDTL